MYSSTPSRFWHVIDKWDVNTFYTAPTAIRALMGAGDDYVKRTDRSSLRLLGSELHRNRDPDALVRGHIAIAGMGTATDELEQAANKISPHPARPV